MADTPAVPTKANEPYSHQPYPTTYYAKPERDERGHITKYFTKEIRNPEDEARLDTDIWRKSPDAWLDDYVEPVSASASSAKALSAQAAEKRRLQEENDDLRERLARLEASASQNRAAVPAPPPVEPAAFEPPTLPSGPAVTAPIGPVMDGPKAKKGSKG